MSEVLLEWAEWGTREKEIRELVRNEVIDGSVNATEDIFACVGSVYGKVVDLIPDIGNIENFVRVIIREEIMRTLLTAEFGFNAREWWIKKLLVESDGSRLLDGIIDNINRRMVEISNDEGILQVEKESLIKFGGTLIEALRDDKFSSHIDYYAKWSSVPEVVVLVFLELAMFELRDEVNISSKHVYGVVRKGMEVFRSSMNEETIESIESMNYDGEFSFCIFYSEGFESFGMNLEEASFDDRLFVALSALVFVEASEKMPVLSAEGCTLPYLEY